MEERGRADDAAFSQAQSADTRAAYESYLSAWPSGRHVVDATAARETAGAREAASVSTALARDAAEQTERDRLARERVASEQADRDRQARDRADDSAWAIARSANSVTAYDAYLRDYPSGRNASAARSARSTLATPAPAAAATYAAYDLSQLNANVRSAAEAARANRAKGEATAARARDAAAKAEDAARRGRAGESGYASHSVPNSGSTDTYEGGWTNGRRNGYGKYTHGTGAFAGDNGAGVFVNDLGNGPVVFNYGQNSTSAKYDRLRYEGELVAGKKEGLGVFYWRDGGIYFGTFRGDTASGIGVYQFASGTRYEGECTDGQYSGFGVYWDPQGRVVQAGIWTGGKLTTSLTK